MTDFQDIDEMVNVALELAQASSSIIRKHFRMCRDTSTNKNDKSAIVTEADTEAENLMREIIDSYFPDHSIIGEEYGNKKGDSEYQWILDPIDGTSNFVMGKPIFGTMIALFRDNLPLIGVIHQPILNETFIGVMGRPTIFNRAAAITSSVSSLSNAFMATNPPFMFEDEIERRVLWGLHADTRACEFGGDCFNYAMLAAGHIDITLVSGDSFHDFAAAIPIVVGAGGIITDWEGNALSQFSSGHILATANKQLHTIALERISHYTK